MTAPTSLPYGMRDVKLTRYTDASGTILAAASVDLPNMQTFSWSETEEFQELRGDDRVIAIRGQGALVEWELEAGGISLAAWEIFTGGTVVESGIAPNRKWTLRKLSTQARPYFRAEGQAISDSGGAMHAVVYRCRANDTIEGEFADGEFFITSCSGQGLALLTEGFDLLYDFVQYETASTISTTPSANPTQQNPPTNLAAGSPTSTTIPLTWTAASNGSPATTDYKIQRRVAFGDWTDVAEANISARSATGATVGGLTASTQYQLRVRVVTTLLGASDWTAAVTATTTA